MNWIVIDVIFEEWLEFFEIVDDIEVFVMENDYVVRWWESMKYFIDSYIVYMVNGGLLDKGLEVVNWFFIELFFFFLCMGVMIFLIMENVMN